LYFLDVAAEIKVEECEFHSDHLDEDEEEDDEETEEEFGLDESLIENNESDDLDDEMNNDENKTNSIKSLTTKSSPPPSPVHSGSDAKVNLQMPLEIFKYSGVRRIVRKFVAKKP
jgi:hypothetical protein